MNASTDTTTTAPVLPERIDEVLATYDLDEAREQQARATAVAIEEAEQGNAAEAQRWQAIADRIAERIEEIIAERERDEVAARGADLLAADEERREAERRAEEHRAQQREAAERIVAAMPEVEEALAVLDRLVPEVVADARRVDNYAVRFVSRQVGAALHHVGAPLVGRGFTLPVHRDDPLAAGTPGLTEHAARVLSVRGVVDQHEQHDDGGDQ